MLELWVLGMLDASGHCVEARKVSMDIMGTCSR